jgi:hypothetical protein
MKNWDIVNANPKWNWNAVAINKSIISEIIANDFIIPISLGFSFEFSWNFISLHPDLTWDIVKSKPFPWNFNCLCENPNFFNDVFECSFSPK